MWGLGTPSLRFSTLWVPWGVCVCVCVPQQPQQQLYIYCMYRGNNSSVTMTRFDRHWKKTVWGMEVWKVVIYKGVAHHTGVCGYMTCPESCSTLPCAYFHQAETCLCHCLDVTWRRLAFQNYLNSQLPTYRSRICEHNATSSRHLRCF